MKIQYILTEVAMLRRTITTVPLLFGMTVFCFISLLNTHSANAQGEIQKEIPVWSGGNAPMWDNPAAWGRATHNIDPTRDTHFLRRQAERGDLQAKIIVQARQSVADGKYDQAIAEYKRAAELGWTMYDEWGDLLEAKGDHTGAIRIYRELIYGSGRYYDNDGHIIPPPYDWKENGQSLRTTLQQNPVSGKPSSGTIAPGNALRYALLLVKNGHTDEAIQVRQWSVEAMKERYDKVYKNYPWLLTSFTTAEVKRDPSLFVAQAWMIVGIFDTVRRTDDYPGLLASIRLKKAVAAKPDYAPAWVLLAERYRDIGEWLEPSYLPLAVEAYQKADLYARKAATTATALNKDESNKAKEEVTTKVADALKEIKMGKKGQTLIYY